MTMDLVRDVQGPATALGDRDGACGVGFEVPADVIELGVLDDLGGGERRPAMLESFVSLAFTDFIRDGFTCFSGEDGRWVLKI